MHYPVTSHWNIIIRVCSAHDLLRYFPGNQPVSPPPIIFRKASSVPMGSERNRYSLGYPENAGRRHVFYYVATELSQLLDSTSCSAPVYDVPLDNLYHISVLHQKMCKFLHYCDAAPVITAGNKPGIIYHRYLIVIKY